MGDFDISSILQNLSQKDIEQLKSVAAGFFGSDNEGNDNNEPAKKEEASSPLSDLNLDPAMILKVGSLVRQFRQDDDRCVFLNALKPLISEARRKKVDEATKILKLLTLLPHIKDIGLF